MKGLTARRVSLSAGVVAGCVALGALVVPGVAVAAKISEVFVTNDDANSVPVHSVGTSQVAGTVNLGNLPATQEVSGTVNVGNFPGTIGAVPTAPTNPWHYRASGVSGGSGTALVFNAPPGITKLAIGSVTFQNDIDGIHYGRLTRFAAADCQGATLSVEYEYAMPERSSAQSTFPIPLVVDLSDGQSLCYLGLSGTRIWVQGYYY